MKKLTKAQEKIVEVANNGGLRYNAKKNYYYWAVPTSSRRSGEHTVKAATVESLISAGQIDKDKIKMF